MKNTKDGKKHKNATNNNNLSSLYTLYKVERRDFPSTTSFPPAPNVSVSCSIFLFFLFFYIPSVCDIVCYQRERESFFLIEKTKVQYIYVVFSLSLLVGLSFQKLRTLRKIESLQVCTFLHFFFFFLFFFSFSFITNYQSLYHLSP